MKTTDKEQSEREHCERIAEEAEASTRVGLTRILIEERAAVRAEYTAEKLMVMQELDAVITERNALRAERDSLAAEVADLRKRDPERGWPGSDAPEAKVLAQEQRIEILIKHGELDAAMLAKLRAEVAELRERDAKGKP